MNKLIAAFTIALTLTLAVTAYSDSVQEDLQSNLIRLHIIADSDSEADQAVKLNVRDAVLKEIGDKFKNDDIGICRENIINNLGEIEEIADRVLAENGFSYTSRAYYGKFPFPQKSYASLTLPAGEYFGVRVVLGSGKGHNWWCVMYPPLCFTENESGLICDESETALRENLSGEAYDIITGSDRDIVVKFKLVELVQGIKEHNIHFFD